jgi:hypothetical protein
MPLGRIQVLTEGEERSAVAIAGNEPFSGWTKTFTPALRRHRRPHHFAGQIVETGATSDRLAQARGQRSAKQARQRTDCT